MHRVLVIDPNRIARERLALTCLAGDVGVALAENLAEGVRLLLSVPVSVIVVDVAALRLTLREHATLFDRVAPAVPVVVAVADDAPAASRVALELVGFRVVTRPPAVEDLLDKAPGPESTRRSLAPRAVACTLETSAAPNVRI